MEQPNPSSLQIFVTGGVVSSLGKGITAASLGRLLRMRGLSVVMQKLDPYLNVDPGTMNPGEHGEVYVTADGAEVDLDLGHYERFVDVKLTRDSSVTTGSVYQSVLARERSGGYLGHTVQVVPHITNEICDRVLALHRDDVDVVITEIGGTVGDIESLPFLEAARQLRHRLGPDQVCFVHVTLVPTLTNGEKKTKPTQHSVAELRARGITPDVLVVRSTDGLNDSLRDKVADMCGVRRERVVDAVDSHNLYDIPLRLHQGGLDDEVCAVWGLDAPIDHEAITHWSHIAGSLESEGPDVHIAIVGKYDGADAYLSVHEALRHAAGAFGVRCVIHHVDAEALSPQGVRGHSVEPDSLDRHLACFDALLVPGGFGERGFEGKVAAMRYGREKNVPTLGICLGLQAMVVEAARSLSHLPDANSSEWEPQCMDPVVDLMASQRGAQGMGGTMRLGDSEAILGAGTKVQRLYGTHSAVERHRHRYEVNPAYRGVLAAGGLVVSGASADGRLVEFMELRGHDFYLATQAHPEFTSRPDRPNPLFSGLVRAAIANGPLEG